MSNVPEVAHGEQIVWEPLGRLRGLYGPCDSLAELGRAHASPFSGWGGAGPGPHCRPGGSLSLAGCQLSGERVDYERQTDDVVPFALFTMTLHDCTFQTRLD